jgi:hypothetical protein
VLVHGDNLRQKETHNTKYGDAESKKYLAEIRQNYDAWNSANRSLRGPSSVKSEKDRNILEQRVGLFTKYKDFIDQQHYAEKFDSRSNLHSTVIEEFMYYLFRDLVAALSEAALLLFEKVKK